MASAKIRYGILGFGHHGERRLGPAFRNAQHSVLAGIWRRDPAKAQENAKAFAIGRVFDSAEELCASPEIDAVLVASPDALHLRHTLLALERGKPVLCEKPLAMNAAEAEQMIRTAQRSGVRFGVAQNFRWNRSLERLRDLLREGRVGRPVLAAAHFCFQSDRSPRAWIRDAALACGGPIGDVGIHCIDALRFVLGQNVTAVSAVALGNGDPGGLEETAALSLEFEGGALASVQVSFRALYRTFVEVTGSEGLLQAENGLTVDHPVQVVQRAGGVIVQSEEVTNGDAYTRMLDSFSAWVQGKGDFAAAGEDALNNQRALDAAFASWRSGAREKVAA